MGLLKSMMSSASLLAALLGAFALGVSATAAPAVSLRLPDLDNRLVDPFQAPAGTKAIVFLYVSVECPISNRYAPEIRRLYDAFTARGLVFRIVYPNPAESPTTIRAHLKDYGLPPVALRDPKQELAKFTGATITPEAAVYDPQGKRLYLGRIDDRYVSLGLQRPAATEHDLEDALIDTLAGRRVRHATAPAVGCYIADFSR
jgi:hypothetical protein